LPIRIGKQSDCTSCGSGVRELSRSLARSKKGSKRRRERAALWRRDHAHKASRRIVNRFGRIGVEDLNVKGLAAGMHAKQVNDAAWAQLVSISSTKLQNAGDEIVYVDPRGTSQQCPECKKVRPKAFNDRGHSCDCRAEMHRDVASAKVAYFRAFGI
jgi:putative transposase